MGRLSSIALLLLIAQYVASNVVSDRKDISKAGDDNDVASPVEQVGTFAQTNAGSDGQACAKIGEFCINHKDCCTNACLGYMRRCVSGREAEVDEE